VSGAYLGSWTAAARQFATLQCTNQDQDGTPLNGRDFFGQHPKQKSINLAVSARPFGYTSIAQYDRDTAAAIRATKAPPERDAKLADLLGASSV